MRYLLMLAVLFMAVAPILADDDLGTEANAVMKPLVRVKSGNSTGTGTVIYSEDREKTGEFKTFVLTNHHVVSDAIRVVKKWNSLKRRHEYSEENDQVTVEVFSYLRGGRTVLGQPIQADIVAHNADEDMAILKLDYPIQIENVATLLPKDLELHLLEPAIAVGCSLGVDPIVTRGEIVDLEYLIQRKPYIMSTADIIFGNSGGAVFTVQDGRYYFIGVPSRVIVSGGGAVTHMGFFIPIDRIRKFLEIQKLDFLTDPDKTPADSEKARKELQEKANGDDPDPPPNFDRNREVYVVDWYLRARAKDSKVQLVWCPVEGVETYDIYRGDNSSDLVLIAEGVETDYATYLDQGLTNGITYYYKVVTDDGRESPIVSATPSERIRSERTY